MNKRKMPKYSHFFIFSIIFIILMVIMVGFSIPQQTIFVEKIVFASNKDGNFEIYSINPDGSELKNLTNSPANDTSPRLSPDHSKIVFVSDRDNDAGDIFIINTDSLNMRNLTNDDAKDMQPSWSPDGKLILYISDRSNTNGDVFAINTTDFSSFNITEDIDGDMFPSMSPNNMEIVFTSNKKVSNISVDVQINWSIYITEINSFSTELIAQNNNISYWLPSWSYSGNYIAFSSPHSDGLYIYNLLNKDTLILEKDKVFGSMKWSPIESFLATTFRDLEDNNTTGILIFNLTDNTSKIFVHDNYYEQDIAWSTDGKNIASISINNGVGDMFVLDRHNGQYHKILDHVLTVSSETKIDTLIQLIDW